MTLRAMGTRKRYRSSTAQTALDWKGKDPVRTAGKDEQASSVTRAGGGGRQRPEKPDRRCFKTRPLLRAAFAGVASGWGAVLLARCGFSLQAAGGPLVPLPSDRHTSTGTCEFGHSGNNKFFARCKGNSSLCAKTFLTNSFRDRVRRSIAGGEGLDAVRVTNELRHAVSYTHLT